MHLRRALLLFVIVLGMAALVASLSRPIEQRRTDTAPRSPSRPEPPTATARPAPELPSPVTIEAAERQSRKLRAGDAVTVEVAVTEPGSVAIPGMNLSSTADPVTPARFALLPTRPGRYRLVFTSARSERARPAGALVVTSRG